MDCMTCNLAKREGEGVYCSINVPDDVFFIGCGHSECPYYEGDECE